jgi:hypothetical protein
LAEDLEEDVDVLLAMGGKVSSDLQEIIKRRPELSAEPLRGQKRAFSLHRKTVGFPNSLKRLTGLVNAENHRRFAGL